MGELKEVVKPRGKGHFKKSIGLPEIYTYYKRSCIYVGQTPIKFKIFKNLIKYCNLEIGKYILETGEPITLPYSLGNLEVKKIERNTIEGKEYFWDVDYKRSKEVGFIIYHDSPYKYGWNWDRRFKTKIHIKKYKFTACRELSRGLATSIKSGRDYYQRKILKE